MKLIYKKTRSSTKEVLAGNPSEQVHPDEGTKSEQAMLTRRAEWRTVNAIPWLTQSVDTERLTERVGAKRVL